MSTDPVTIAAMTRLRCNACGCGVKPDHIPDSEDCREAADERERSRRE